MAFESSLSSAFVSYFHLEHKFQNDFVATDRSHELARSMMKLVLT